MTGRVIPVGPGGGRDPVPVGPPRALATTVPVGVGRPRLGQLADVDDHTAVDGPDLVLRRSGGRYQVRPARPAVDTAAVAAIVDTALATHTADPAPHTAYDGIPSLVLYFENGLIP